MAGPPNAPKPADKRAPTFTPAQLDAMSAITPADIADAQDAWRRDAPAAFRTLLDATLTENPET